METERDGQCCVLDRSPWSQAIGSVWEDGLEGGKMRPGGQGGCCVDLEEADELGQGRRRGGEQ